MKVILLDNGSQYLLEIRRRLGPRLLQTVGLPFAPGVLKKIVKGGDALVISAERLPVGLDLPYFLDLIAEIGSLKIPVFALGRGAEIFFEARGGKVKFASGRYAVRRSPSGFTNDGGIWRNAAGETAIFEVADDWPKELDKFISSFEK